MVQVVSGSIVNSRNHSEGNTLERTAIRLNPEGEDRGLSHNRESPQRIIDKRTVRRSNINLEEILSRKI